MHVCPCDNWLSHHVPISSSVYSTLGIGSPLSTDRSDMRTDAIVCVLSLFLPTADSLTVCIWRRCLQSFASSACKPRPCSPVQIHDVKTLITFSVFPHTGHTQQHKPSQKWGLVSIILRCCKRHYLQDGPDPDLDQILWPDDDICPNQLFSLGTSELGKEQSDASVLRWFFFYAYGRQVLLHLTSLVVFTSSAFLFREPMRVLTSDRCSSQRTKYSRPSMLSLSFRHGRVSRWWIFASKV